ncbi:MULTISPECIES: hypothetical protein [Burkholderia]|uniref:hypothetical protein n=1 Tax=Burkholderia TaxID=32008 RepID=UPI00158333C8|nr:MULTISPECIES: hypothetical protein [Burkholderia]MBN3768710.1 hypothetical protein [Burkholderia sp. Se-20378]MBN3794844.1 hypothetical protein [Burkholderia sp. Ac-20392]
MLKRGRIDAGRIGIHRAEKHVRASLKQVLRSSRQQYICYGIGRISTRDAPAAAAPPSDGDTLA